MKQQTDERTSTEPKQELLTVPSSSPYTVRLDEVPEESSGVKIHRVGPTTKTGTGTGACVSSGTYTGMIDRSYKVQIDTAGGVGTATFKWSRDGITWVGTLIPISDTDPISLELDVYVAFTQGTYVLGDYWTFPAEYWTEVEYVPTQSKEYQVNYVNGDIDFHSANAGKTFYADYEGRGSLVDAGDINQIIDYLESGEWVSDSISALAQLIVVNNGDVITQNDEIVYIV